MTVIYITENNCECYAVTFQNKGWIKVQKFQDESFDENIIYTVNPMEIFLGKSQSCTMTALSGAFDKACFDGNTILLKVGIENGKNKHVYIGGDMVCSFMTSDNIYEHISNMGNNLSPYSMATGEEKYFLLTPNYSFIKKDKIDHDDIMKGIYVPDFYLPFEKLELCKIHYDNDNDDDNLIVIIFKLIAMTVEIHFILHVANGFHIIIQVYLHEYIYKY